MENIIAVKTVVLGHAVPYAPVGVGVLAARDVQAVAVRATGAVPVVQEAVPVVREDALGAVLAVLEAVAAAVTLGIELCSY